MNKRNQGFTLVELVVVLVVLAILIGVTIGGIYMYVGKSKVNTDINNDAAIESVLSTISTDDDVVEWSQNAETRNDAISITWSKKHSSAGDSDEDITIVRKCGEPANYIFKSGESFTNKIDKLLSEGLPDRKNDGVFSYTLYANVSHPFLKVGAFDSSLVSETETTTSSSPSSSSTSTSPPIVPSNPTIHTSSDKDDKKEEEIDKSKYPKEEETDNMGKFYGVDWRYKSDESTIYFYPCELTTHKLGDDFFYTKDSNGNWVKNKIKKYVFLGKIKVAKEEKETVYNDWGSYSAIYREFVCDLFDGMETLETIEGLENLDISDVTCCEGMFSRTNIQHIDLSSLDFSSATNMGGLFRSCKNLESVEFGDINTSNVLTFQSMFSECSKLKSIDVSKFDTSKCRSMYGMFSDCGITNIDLSNFDTSNLASFNSMFQNCTDLKHLDLSSFSTEKCVSVMSERWKASDPARDGRHDGTVLNEGFGQMFSGCSSLKDLDISSFSSDLKFSDLYKFNARNPAFYHTFDKVPNDINIKYPNDAEFRQYFELAWSKRTE